MTNLKLIFCYFLETPHLNHVETTESEMLNEQNVQIDFEKVTSCEYIETSTPYQQANDSDMLADRKDETAMGVEQIDSIKSNNRDDSSDDKTNLSDTNQLSDTTEEIETFTRKETNQYRVLSMPESAPILENSTGKYEDSSEVYNFCNILEKKKKLLRLLYIFALNQN